MITLSIKNKMAAARKSCFCFLFCFFFLHFLLFLSSPTIIRSPGFANDMCIYVRYVLKKLLCLFPGD